MECRSLLDGMTSRNQRFFVEELTDELQPKRHATRVQTSRDGQGRDTRHAGRNCEDVIEIHLHRIGWLLILRKAPEGAVGVRSTSTFSKALRKSC